MPSFPDQFLQKKSFLHGLRSHRRRQGHRRVPVSVQVHTVELFSPGRKGKVQIPAIRNDDLIIGYHFLQINTDVDRMKSDLSLMTQDYMGQDRKQFPGQFGGPSSGEF
jgi:hypothetical protein